MGIKTGQQAHTGLVEKYIGTAFDEVKVVHDNLADVIIAATGYASIAADTATTIANAASTTQDAIDTAADAAQTAADLANVAASIVGLNKGIADMAQNITEDYTIAAGRNAFSINPTVDPGVTVTVTAGTEWVIIGA